MYSSSVDLWSVGCILAGSVYFYKMSYTTLFQGYSTYNLYLYSPSVLLPFLHFFYIFLIFLLLLIHLLSFDPQHFFFVLFFFPTLHISLSVFTCTFLYSSEFFSAFVCKIALIYFIFSLFVICVSLVFHFYFICFFIPISRNVE